MSSRTKAVLDIECYTNYFFVALCNGEAFIGRAAINNDDLVVVETLRNNAFKRLSQKTFRILDGNDNREKRLCHDFTVLLRHKETAVLK